MPHPADRLGLVKPEAKPLSKSVTKSMSGLSSKKTQLLHNGLGGVGETCT